MKISNRAITKSTVGYCFLSHPETIRERLALTSLEKTDEIPYDEVGNCVLSFLSLSYGYMAFPIALKISFSLGLSYSSGLENGGEVK